MTFIGLNFNTRESQLNLWNLEKILIHQKRSVWCLAGHNAQKSCREAEKNLKIVIIISLYMQDVVLHPPNQISWSTATPIQYSEHIVKLCHPIAPPYSIQKEATLFLIQKTVHLNHLPDHLRREQSKTFKMELIKCRCGRDPSSEKENSSATNLYLTICRLLYVYILWPLYCSWRIFK